MRVFLAFLLVLGMSNGTRASRLLRDAQRDHDRDRTAASNRFIDMGVRLHVVKMDLERGQELLPRMPPLTVLRTVELGGVVDTRPLDGGSAYVCGPSVSPVDWYCSEDAAPVILHDDDMPSRILLYGSEGAGKTHVLVQWLYVQAIEATGANDIIGVTSPTAPRSQTIREAIADLWPAHWWDWHGSLNMYTLANQARIHLQTTTQQSKEQGSRVQSINWRAAASDEIQDSLTADPDIEMRGRRAPGGRMKRLCTASSKDSSAFRTWREKRLATSLWGRRTLLGPRSPFVWPQFWAEKKETLDADDYRRRILAEDVSSGNRVYYGFDRSRNVAIRPDLARDVSAEMFEGYRPITRRNIPGSFAMAVGHDPGEIVNVSTLAKPYLVRDEIVWFVVGQLVTKRTTAEQHAAALLRYVRETHGLNLDVSRGGSCDRVLVFCDPHGKGDGDTDYATVYKAFLDVGLDCFNPAGNEPRIQRRARIDMVNRMFHPASGAPRLCVQRYDDGSLAANDLVESLEQLERDPNGAAERGRKNENDKTHGPVTLGYLLWPFEAPAVAEVNRKRVLRAIGRAA